MLRAVVPSATRDTGGGKPAATSDHRHYPDQSALIGKIA